MPVNVSKLLQRVILPLVVAIIAAVLGGVFGVSTVKIVNTGLWQTDISYQSIYVQAVADAYAQDGNQQLAVERLALLCQADGSIASSFQQAQERYGADSAKSANLGDLRVLVDGGQVQPNPNLPVCSTSPIGSSTTMGFAALGLLVLILIGFAASGVFMLIRIGEDEAEADAAAPRPPSVGGVSRRTGDEPVRAPTVQPSAPSSRVVSAPAPAAPEASRAVASPALPDAPESAPAPPEEKEEKGGGLFSKMPFGGRSAAEDTAPASAAAMGAQISKSIPKTDFSETQAGPPIVQFMTTYLHGDDLYDDSFSIETASGEFLGETGVGISDTLDSSDAAKKVSAFEVWLFDKNDIRTVTKVLMSDYAFNNDDTRAKLAAKGEAVLAQPGSRFVLETASLRVQARVVDISYGSGPFPPNSFMERITIELAAWQQSGGAG